jgi:hypothetical protein
MAGTITNTAAFILGRAVEASGIRDVIKSIDEPIGGEAQLARASFGQRTWVRPDQAASAGMMLVG